jgi:uncharacterized protein
MWTAIGISLLVLPAVIVVAFILYLTVYVRKNMLGQFERVFTEKPLFIIPRGEPDPAAAIEFFETPAGRLRGIRYATSAPACKGIIVFGIEFGSDAWSSRPYCEALVQAGYEIFAYEPRGQGESDPIPGYEPLQWVTETEVADARAALAHVKHRTNGALPIGWFGISKGANAGLAATALDRDVRCIATDGAFGMLTVMVPYMRHWVGIYNSDYFTHGLLPAWFYGEMALIGVRRVEKQRKIRFFRLEKVMPKLDRPLLMIHGEADSYIKLKMADSLLKLANGPKTLWPVPGARHNQAIVVAGAEYARRIIAFFDEHLAGPTRP